MQDTDGNVLRELSRVIDQDWFLGSLDWDVKEVLQTISARLDYLDKMEQDWKFNSFIEE